MIKPTQSSHYKSFNDLAACYQVSRDYSTSIKRTDSPIAIIAPHGGKIEPGTSEIASEIAQANFNLYLFEGLLKSNNYGALHLSSHCFDEPECLNLLSFCSIVISIHGCKGDDESVYLGGLDSEHKNALYELLSAVGIRAEVDNAKYLGMHRSNICNRGTRQMGVQIEVSKGLRDSENKPLLIQTIREYLLDSN